MFAGSRESVAEKSNFWHCEQGEGRQKCKRAVSGGTKRTEP